MRIVVTEEHEAEGAFLKNKNFVFVSFKSLAPRDYVIQQVELCICGVNYSCVHVLHNDSIFFNNVE